MLRRFIITILLVLPGFLLHGQPRSVNIAGTYSLSVSMYGQEEKAILGSPYLNPQWMYGDILFTDSTHLNTLIRLNLEGNEVEMIVDRDTLGLARPLNLVHFRLNNRKFIYSYLIGQEYGREYISAGFFEELSAGRVQLLLNHYVEIEENSYASNYMGGGGDGREYWVKKYRMYYRTEQRGAAREIMRKKKDVLDLFADHRDKVNEFMRNEKINLKDDVDVLRLFRYYNSISEVNP